MFYRYEIKNNGIENILYLYLTMNYEFSKELSKNADDGELKRRTTNFIKNNGIQFDGNKVYLVIDGIVVKAFQISKEEDINKKTNKNTFDDLNYMVTVQLEDQSIIEISLQEFLLGVLATNMIPNLSIEVLKAMAILYRTYVFKQMKEEKLVSATNNFFVYKPIDYYKIAFAPDYDNIVATLKDALSQTNAMFVTYQGEYILPFIHVCNFGHTLEDTRYPYLSSVGSLWDAISPFYVDSTSFSYDLLSSIFHFTITKDSEFMISEISPYGKVLKLSIAGQEIDGGSFMRLLHLKSQFLSIILNKDDITIITKGWGDFLGLSLWGASHLADNGCSYANILSYYFPKVRICEYVKELS